MSCIIAIIEAKTALQQLFWSSVNATKTVWRVKLVWIHTMHCGVGQVELIEMWGVVVLCLKQGAILTWAPPVCLNTNADFRRGRCKLAGVRTFCQEGVGIGKIFTFGPWVGIGPRHT